MQGGRRGAAQVLANSLMGAACAVAAARFRGGGGGGRGCAGALLLDAAFVAFYACCAGDTWSSEASPLWLLQNCLHA